VSGAAALVVEGGAMRGIFASGVLDVFHEQSFQPFDFAIGCSSGGCILASHLAGQRGRNLLVFTKYMTRPEFIDARRFLRGGHWVDFDWLWQATERDHPIDRAKLMANRVKLVLSATSYATGEPVYLQPGPADLMQALKSSCALPILCRDPVHVGDQRLMDGGIAAPIPVHEAYRRGARRILVIRSRPAAFVKRASALRSLSALAFRTSPAFARAMRNAHASYANAVQFIASPPADCEVLHVAPPHTLATRRTTQNIRALERDYALGREVGARAIHAWNHGLESAASSQAAHQLRTACC
jgi:predicted patatin/cPLA2 family phospholipase